MSAALAGALFARLVPALVLPVGARYEIEVFRQAGAATLSGQSVYLSPIAHPYPPLEIYWFAASVWLAEHVGLSFVHWVKLGNIAAELGLVAIVYWAVRPRRGRQAANLAAWLFAVNPVTVLVSAYQGQFDSWPLLCLLTAWAAWTLSPGRRWALPVSAIALGLGVQFKIWPLFLAPILFLRWPRWRQRLLFALISAAVPALCILFFELVFPGSLGPLWRRASSAGAIPGWWGLSAPLNVLVTFTGRGQAVYDTFNALARPMALAGAGIAVLLTRRWEPLRSLLVVILMLFAGVPNLGLQGLSWLIPVAIVLGAWDELPWYVAGATVHMWLSYWGLHLTDGMTRLFEKPIAFAIIQLSALLPWSVVIVWLLRMLTNHSSQAPRLIERHRAPQ